MAAPLARRSLTFLLGFVILLPVVFYLGGGWFFAGQVYADALESRPYDAGSLETGKITELSLDRDAAGDLAGTVTVERDAEFADETKNNQARVGLTVGDVVLISGPVSGSAGAAVTRPVLEVLGVGADGARIPQVGDAIGLSRDVGASPSQLGWDYQEVEISSPGGALPAWLVPGTSAANSQAGKWAVLVHGKNATRAENLRMAQPLRAAGYTVLMITYAGDEGAPPAADGRVHYGIKEWTDLQAAVQFAQQKGATELVLGGISHGGAVVMGFMQRAPEAAAVSALILDAPATDFRGVLDEVADLRSLPLVGLPIPESLEDVAFWISGQRFGLDYAVMDYSDASGVGVPVLVFQGDADQTVPVEVTRAFAATNDKIKLIEVPGADHVLAWNHDPEAFEQTVADFLSANGLD